MTKLTHFRKLQNPTYLGSYDFEQGEERIVTIKSVVVEAVIGSDGKKDDCTVCYFNEPIKPMILNSTNLKMIAKLSDTPYIENWVGKQFKIVVTKVKAFGEIHDALRIKSEKVVTAKPVLQFGTANFDACKKAFKADPTSMDKIKSKYSVDAEVEAQLNA